MGNKEKIIQAESEMKDWISKYGKPEKYESYGDVSKFDPKRIWSEIWVQDQFVTNQIILDETATSYFVTPNPYSEADGLITVVTTIWEDCDICSQADEVDEDCEICEGSGSYATDIWE